MRSLDPRNLLEGDQCRSAARANNLFSPFSTGDFAVSLDFSARLTASFNLSNSNLTINDGGGAKLVNNQQSDFAGTNAVINADVVGTGSFQDTAVLGVHGFPITGVLEFGGGVSYGQTVFVGHPIEFGFHGPSQDLLKIDQPREFHGAVTMDPSAAIDLVGLAKANSYGFDNDLLSIWSGHRVIDTLRLTNQAGADLVVSKFGSDVCVTQTG